MKYLVNAMAIIIVSAGIILPVALAILIPVGWLMKLL